MPTNPDLAALSAAATQGEWEVDGPPHNRIIWSSPNDRVCFMAHSDGKDVERDMATPAFITALVNEYRAGRLVHIDEGMRERVLFDYRFQAACHRYAHEGGSSEAIAAAAIAAMMGETK